MVGSYRWGFGLTGPSRLIATSRQVGYNRFCLNGDYGEMVLTTLCGSVVTGSIPVSPPYIAMIPWKTLSDDEKKFVRFWLFVLGSGIAGVVVVLRWVVGIVSA